MPSSEGQFQEGQSGNPAGRPKGARNRTTLAMEALLQGEAEALTRKAVEMALEGDGAAMRLCLERLYPARKDNPVTFDLPPIDTTADLPKASAKLLEAVSTGEVTPAEAADIARAIDAHAKTIEVRDLQERIERLEQRDQQ